MKWHVLWNARGERGLQKALDETGASDKVIIAVEEIERLLEQDPFEAGESREEGERILILNGYAVLYGINSNDHLVVINAFWRWAK
jgi:hypothetical protein